MKVTKSFPSPIEQQNQNSGDPQLLDSNLDFLLVLCRPSFHWLGPQSPSPLDIRRYLPSIVANNIYRPHKERQKAHLNIGVLAPLVLPRVHEVVIETFALYLRKQRLMGLREPFQVPQYSGPALSTSHRILLTLAQSWANGNTGASPERGKE